MFEASHSGHSSAPPEKIWAMWENPARWPGWNEQLESAELDGPLALGAKATVKFKRGGRMVFEVREFEHGLRFVDEAKLIGCRFGHEHSLRPDGSGVEITHRLYLEGPFSGLFAVLFGRKKMRESVVAFVDREREFAE